jgi:hypothetical protein
MEVYDNKMSFYKEFYEAAEKAAIKKRNRFIEEILSEKNKTFNNSKNKEKDEHRYDYIQGYKNPFKGETKRLFYEYAEKHNIKFSGSDDYVYSCMMQSEYNRRCGHTLKLAHETPTWEVGADLLGSFVDFLDML